MNSREEPQGLIAKLRERAKVARDEMTGTALGDALHFEEAANEIERLRADHAQRPLRDALIGLNDAIDLYWNDGRTDGQIKNIAYWQFKSKEALSAITSTGVEAPAQSPLDRDKVMEVINDRLADYEEIESRNDLTELGRHAKLAIQILKRDVEYALTSTVRNPIEKTEDSAS